MASIFMVVLSFFILAGCGSRLNPGQVGNSSITEGDLDTLTRVNPRLKPRLATPDGKQKILENYVEQELLYQESKEKGPDSSKDVKDKIDLYEKILIAQALLDDELDKKVKEYYENHRDEFERLKISHILIRTAPNEAEPAKSAAKKPKDKKKEAPAKSHSEAEAMKLVDQVKERLAKGEDFGKVAKEVSEDEKTKNTQGDLGQITIRDKKLERISWLPLAEKAFAMKTGEVSDVIKTKDGLHLIKVTEDKKVQPFEEAEAGIRFRLQADIRTGLLEELKKKYKVEYAKSEAPAKTVPQQGAAPEAPTAPTPGTSPEPAAPPAEAPATEPKP